MKTHTHNVLIVALVNESIQSNVQVKIKRRTKRRQKALVLRSLEHKHKAV